MDEYPPRPPWAFVHSRWAAKLLKQPHQQVIMDILLGKYRAMKIASGQPGRWVWAVDAYDIEKARNAR